MRLPETSRLKEYGGTSREGAQAQQTYPFVSIVRICQYGGRPAFPKRKSIGNYRSAASICVAISR